MRFSASAPGRICLFGEHQDYFGFPVVASAIDLRTTIHTSSREDRLVQVQLTDLNKRCTYDLDDLENPNPREYLLVALHLAKREGWLPQMGWDAEVSSQIPMQAGASSSSALLVAWCAVIAHRSGQNWNQEWIARAAWRAEVEWFNEPGGMMDQTVCALGGTQLIEFDPVYNPVLLPVPPGTWVLFDSMEPKDTLGILSRAKDRRLELIGEWEMLGGLDWNLRPPEFPGHWTEEDQRLMMTTLENRRISSEGAMALSESTPDLAQIGSLLQEHHQWLSQGIEVSTPRIDRILKCAQESGATGGKINGSGGGGTGFVVCQSRHNFAVIEAIDKAGGQPFSVALGAQGVRIEQPLN